ncbi:radical SAM protein [Poseidonibacter ostreae]|uniref:Radical SAM protein n=1 Tax=Poseidonibacter ostreae TaxID=2654171 RepID=A0A6L4WSA5_9BACT|nr:radical SAM protein [Poseidonibacter ostreae]KAB7884425.1 radical SAM protein [Poseidonibacter ostreae]KAB7888789.1 radical SAM protein [Poseidonibacter ostreae]KAB7891186.1 radical SAM protein [Poseidonibacter ostreae]MAC84862.1 radical SAM protein [Arcobacter sp.]|tara:strand:+ start:4102 stop:4950 length:849 start_codon:yes stop_codon:yes gene_type:complete
MIAYNQPLYRPPAEANSIIIQATLGCSFNKCTFCTMYESKEFVVRPLEEVFLDIDKMATSYGDANKMFLADGDALACDTEHLIKILEYAYNKFPKLRRVSIYASAFNLHDKSLDELKLLKEKGLNLIYYGIESGSYEVLKRIQKPISNQKMCDGLNKAYEAGMKISVTVILGVAGKKYSKLHIEETAKILNQIKITYLSTLQLMLEQHTKQRFIKNFDGEFELLSTKEMLKEQKYFLELLNPMNKVIFRSNHASNSLALAGTLPKDKCRLVDEVSYIIDNYL